MDREEKGDQDGELKGREPELDRWESGVEGGGQGAVAREKGGTGTASLEEEKAGDEG